MSRQLTTREAALYAQGFSAGRAEERRAVVAWLRSHAAFTQLLKDAHGFVPGQNYFLANVIEFGRHLDGGIWTVAFGRWRR